jgi:hypothetical protein
MSVRGSRRELQRVKKDDCIIDVAQVSIVSIVLVLVGIPGLVPSAICRFFSSSAAVSLPETLLEPSSFLLGRESEHAAEELVLVACQRSFHFIAVLVRHPRIALLVVDEIP